MYPSCEDAGENYRCSKKLRCVLKKRFPIRFLKVKKPVSALRYREALESSRFRRCRRTESLILLKTVCWLRASVGSVPMCCSRGIKDKNGARDKERQRRGRGEGGRERARARERESERARSASRSLPTYESTARKIV